MAAPDLRHLKWHVGEGVNGAGLIENLAQRPWRIVKQTPKRKIFAVGAFFVKVYLSPDLWERCKKLWIDAARREWHIAHELYASCGHTPQPLAWARGPHRSLLVTRSVEPCTTAAEFCRDIWPGLNQKTRYQVVDAFAEFLLRLHAAGLMQTDFNLGNLLVRQDGPAFFLVDLQRCRLARRPLSMPEVVENLSCLLPPFLDIPRRYHLRFFLGIVRNMPALRSKLYAIQSLAYQRLRHHWRTKIRRKFTAASLGRHSSSPAPARGYLADGLEPQLRALLLENPAELEHLIVKDFKNSDRSRVSLLEWRQRRYVLKFLRPKSLLWRWRRMLRPNQAWRCWQTHHLVAARSVPTPQLYAAVDLGRRAAYAGTLALYEYVRGTEGYIERLNCALRTAGRSHALRRLADLLWWMHQAGIYHGDAKITNFLHATKEGQTRIQVVDLDSVRFVPRIGAAQRFSDLKDLTASLVWWDRDMDLADEFFEAYLRPDPHWCRHPQHWRRRLRKAVQRQLAHRAARQKR